jgi:hypothetical protein
LVEDVHVPQGQPDEQQRQAIMQQIQQNADPNALAAMQQALEAREEPVYVS